MSPDGSFLASAEDKGAQVCKIIELLFVPGGLSQKQVASFYVERNVAIFGQFFQAGMIETVLTDSQLIPLPVRPSAVRWQK